VAVVSVGVALAGHRDVAWNSGERLVWGVLLAVVVLVRSRAEKFLATVAWEAAERSTDEVWVVVAADQAMAAWGPLKRRVEEVLIELALMSAGRASVVSEVAGSLSGKVSVIVPRGSV
jgi:hypothetical protein